MNRQKKSILNQTYRNFLRAGLGLEDEKILKGIVAENLMGFGTTMDEKIMNFGQLKEIIKQQKKQSKGMDFRWTVKPLSHYTSADENTAVFADEVILKIVSAGEAIKMYMRFSIVLSYNNNQWKVIHWHGSKPENVESEEDTFGLKNWKQKAIELGKLVDERTAELVEKNRELEIDAALERVRLRTMAMQNSSELAELVTTLFRELTQLDFVITSCIIWINNSELATNTLWVTSSGMNQPSRPIHFTPFHHSFFRSINHAWKDKDPKWIYQLKGSEKKSFEKEFFDEVHNLPKALKSALVVPKKVIFSASFNNFGALEIIGTEPLSDEKFNILHRFGKLFDASYTRFNDLKNAEAHAREAEIQLALERVRARTMAMHKSNELGEAAVLLFEQIKHLGVQTYANGFNTWDQKHENVVSWMSNPTGSINPPFVLPVNSFSQHKHIYAEWKKKKQFLEDDIRGRRLVEHYKFLHSFPLLNQAFKRSEAAGIKTPDRQVHNIAFFSQGYLLFITTKPCPAYHPLFIRFAKIFEQTYTRFLDLQKAEAQAREAQIETGLERVRSSSLAMHHTSELQEVIHTVHKELLNLNISIDGGSFIVINKDVDTQLRCWGSGGTANTSEEVFLPLYKKSFLTNLINGIKKGPGFFTEEFSHREKKDFFTFLFRHKPWSALSTQQKNETLSAPGGYTRSVAVSLYTSIVIINHQGKKFSDAENDILKRFAKVFEQTYTRFLDLQKAEGQAREAQIEGSLEKVRSSSLAMHSSDEMQAVVNTVIDQLQKLNIVLDTTNILIFNKHEKFIEFWTGSNSTGAQLTTGWRVPYFNISYYKAIHQAHENGKEIFTGNYSFTEKNKLFKHLFANTDFKNLNPERKTFILKSPRATIVAAITKDTAIQVISYTRESFSENEIEILKRFSKVFNQAYTRFLDLQKVEAQAREAEIELGLERVRSRAMAMQSSEEVNELIGTVFTELTKLDLLLTRCIIWVFQPATLDARWWMANIEEPSNPMNFYIKYHEHPAYLVFVEAWKRQNVKFVYDLRGQDKKNWDDFLFNETELKNLPGVVKNGMREPERVLLSASFNNFGGINVASLEPLSEEHFNILLRFAKVFDLTYTRFLDLQKAEAQTREAKIETALEKVRARAMAMQKPNELIDVAQLLRKEMGLLGVEELETSSIYIHNETTGNTECWYAIKNEEKLVSDHMTIELKDTWVGREMFDFYRSDKNQTSIIMQGANRKEWINYCSEKSKALTGFYGDEIPDRTYHLYKFSGGYIGAASPGNISSESWDLLKRATNVFSLAYTRFNDLQIAEANAKEAIKQAALDRIRADIASMRTTKDLERITPLIWNELTILGIPFIRCGVFIMDDEEQLIHTFLSTPDGKAIAAFHLPYNVPGNISLVLQNWRKKKNYIDHWDEQTFRDFAHSLVQQGALSSIGQYMKTLPQGGFYLHFLPFLQGMLYVGNTIRLSDEEINLLQSVADAFATAYARYEDFNKLEAAKKQVDSTLTELQSTQKQLIQSEKMASLGELTAGIAHEIQNPLNFVNNFSEVSTELVDEMKEELAKSNYEDANVIADDLKQNLEKINHHGRRAGDIVKGMLQHSRKSEGKKELTDINALCDEYLRLAYHGLRAKDKSFNAVMKTDFDETLPKMNVVPQDLGRVILNLINNAFYAAPLPPPGGEGFREPDGKHVPTVWVSTKRETDKVVISVWDNGSGIPKEILDKIFQPFFTTKPTGQGTGLGLSLSYDIVKAHGGEIKVETKESEGTTFIIQLPV